MFPATARVDLRQRITTASSVSRLLFPRSISVAKEREDGTRDAGQPEQQGVPPALRKGNRKWTLCGTQKAIGDTRASPRIGAPEERERVVDRKAIYSTPTHIDVIAALNYSSSSRTRAGLSLLSGTKFFFFFFFCFISWQTSRFRLVHRALASASLPFLFVL